MVTMETTLGTIYLELFKNKVPTTVNNFLAYAHQNFYDNTIFHRVIENFMVQGGGYTARPFEEKKVGSPIVLESKAGLHNFQGTIAMARTTEANSATSQFFINLKNNFFLDYASAKNPGYAVFGKVLTGFDVAQAIAKVELFPESTQPLEDVVVRSTEITQFYAKGRDQYKLTFNGTDYFIGSGKSAKVIQHIDSLQFSDKKLWLSTESGSVVGTEYSELIFGNSDKNIIDGGLGDDEINGLEGNDQLTGGQGEDRFVLSTVFSGSNIDTITDFESDADTIVISQSLLGKAYRSKPKTLVNDFISDTNPMALDKTDRFLYDKQTGVLSFDADGSGVIEAVVMVILTGAPQLEATDLVIL
jgi:peptidyl-prolyl cis-trans isomerase A (cyclophilin A)/peptidyl-prolyl cis-trans isomerase B (cyclophilin B)